MHMSDKEEDIVATTPLPFWRRIVKPEKKESDSIFLGKTDN